MKNYNLLLDKRKILKIFITCLVFEIEKFIGDVKFVLRQPSDQICRHFWLENLNFLKMVAYPVTWSSAIVTVGEQALYYYRNTYKPRFAMPVTEVVSTFSVVMTAEVDWEW